MTLKLRVISRNMETNEIEVDRIIDHDDREDRVWLGRHCYWAFRNGRSIATSAVCCRTKGIADMTIVKIQRPLASSEDDPPWLIYGKGYRHRELRPADQIPTHVRKAMRRKPKAFFEAEWDEDRQVWRIGQPAASQAW